MNSVFKQVLDAMLKRNACVAASGSAAQYVHAGLEKYRHCRYALANCAWSHARTHPAMHMSLVLTAAGRVVYAQARSRDIVGGPARGDLTELLHADTHVSLLIRYDSLLCECPLLARISIAIVPHYRHVH